MTAVHHPSRPGADPLGLIGRQQSGPGSVLSFDVRGGLEAASRVATSMRLVTHAVSLGGTDSLIEHPASLTHRVVEESAKPHESLLRMSVGLEDLEDLVADLDQALRAAH